MIRILEITAWAKDKKTMKWLADSAKTTTAVDGRYRILSVVVKKEQKVKQYGTESKQAGNAIRG